jgi:ATP-dependent DNA helicase RecG
MSTELVIENHRVILTNPNNPHGNGPIDLNGFNPFPKNPNIRKFFTAMGWTDEIGSGIRNTKKYLPLYVEGAKPQFIEDYTFTAIIPLHHATMIRFFDKWMQWMDFDTKYALYIEKALKNIPLQGIAPELDWNQLIVLLVPSWSEKGTRLKELDWPKKQPLTPDEIKMVPSWAQKGTKLLHKKVVYYISIIMLSAQAISLDDLMSAIGYSNKATFRENYLKPLETLGFISKTNPDNPKASNQKYYTTSKGIQFLTNTESNN